jgi:hypothetical protein
MPSHAHGPIARRIATVAGLVLAMGILALKRRRHAGGHAHLDHTPAAPAGMARSPYRPNGSSHRART